MKDWSPSGFHLEHYQEQMLLIWVDLYEGKNLEAERRAREVWSPLVRSLLTRVQLLRIDALTNRCLASLAVAEVDPERKVGALRTARGICTRIDREGSALASARAVGLRAAIASASGEPSERVVAHAREAVNAFAGMGCIIHEVLCRRLLGLAMGGDEGRAIVLSTEQWMLGQSVRDPAKFSRCFMRGYARFEPPAS
jgi:hypothetical protein